MTFVGMGRHLPYHGGARARPIPASTVAVENAARREAIASPRDGSTRDLVLTCHWEEGEDQYVQVEGETFRCGHMLMHWMPVH